MGETGGMNLVVGTVESGKARVDPEREGVEPPLY